MRAALLVAIAVIVLTVHSDESFAAPSRYEFTNVYDTTMVPPGGGFSFTGTWQPSLSDGQAAFQSFWDGFRYHGIFTGDGGPIELIASDADANPASPFQAVERPSIDNSEVAFVGYYNYPFNQGVFKYSCGVITPIVEKGDPAPSSTFRAFDYQASGFTKFPVVGISDGTLAFRGVYGIDDEGIFTSDGGPFTTIVKTGDTAPTGQFRSFGDPAISGNTVAFLATYARSGQAGIFTGSGGPLTKIVRDGDPAPEGIFLSFGDPTISGDTVAFQASFGSDQQGIFVGNGGALTTIVKEGDSAPVGTFSMIGGFDSEPPAIVGNTVAFDAYYGTATYENHGIFINRNGISSLVIKKGDLLFGSTVRSVAVYKFGLDSDGSGKLAFAYSLEGGPSGIAIVTLVPEPGGFTLALAMLVMTAITLTARS